jgi:hypothetical protein
MQTKTANGRGGSAAQLEAQVAKWVRESHRRQFEGEDYQQICWGFLNSKAAQALGLTADHDDIWREVESSPQPTCECGFCEHAAWQ